MEITLNDISRRIKEIADERGYTPYALAEKVPQVVQFTVYNALSGTKSMKVETLLSLKSSVLIFRRMTKRKSGWISRISTTLQKMHILANQP